MMIENCDNIEKRDPSLEKWQDKVDRIIQEAETSNRPRGTWDLSEIERELMNLLEKLSVKDRSAFELRVRDGLMAALDRRYREGRYKIEVLDPENREKDEEELRNLVKKIFETREEMGINSSE